MKKGTQQPVTQDSTRSQLELIRKEKQAEFARKKAGKYAQTLLESLYELQKNFLKYELPTSRNVDLFSSQKMQDKYFTALNELQGPLGRFTQIWQELDSDEIPGVVSYMLALKGIIEDSSHSSLPKQLNSIAQTLCFLHTNVTLYLNNHINDRDANRKGLDNSNIAAANIVKRKIEEFIAGLQHQTATVSAEQHIESTQELSEELGDATDLDISMLESTVEHLPEELQLMILTKLSLADLLEVRASSKTLNRMADIAMDDITQPKFIINYLRKANGIQGHQFISAYQHTTKYKALKSKVINNEPMTPDEIVCYTLTRDSKLLPQALEMTIDTMKLDEKTKGHLQLILKASKLQSTGELISLFLNSHPKKFVNLLAGRPLFQANLVGKDLSDASLIYAEFNRPCDKTNMSGMILRGANLSHARLDACLLINADLRGAKLNHANLNGADLTNAKLDGADLRGADLTLTKIINVDLRSVDLSHVNLEWTYLKNVRLVPDESLQNPQALRGFLTHFQETTATHSPGSQRNLQEQLLHDIARQISGSETLSVEMKLELLKTVLAQYNPTTMLISLVPFENPCLTLFHQLGRAGTEKKPQQAEHPLKQEFLDLVRPVLDEIYDYSPRPAAPVRRGHQKQLSPMEQSIDRIVWSKIKAINECLAKDPSLTNGTQICQAFGISEYDWHLIFNLVKSPLYLPNQRPTVSDYPTEVPRLIYENYSENHKKYKLLEGTKHYASEVFNGEIFEVKLLQQIKEDELQQYLFGDEDFAITKEGRDKNIVKLGDLLFTYEPGGKGSVFSDVQFIDFKNKKLNPCFRVDFQRRGSLKFEMFLPLDPFAKYAATAVSSSIVRRDLNDIEAGYALKKKVIERIFATQKGPTPTIVQEQLSDVSFNGSQLSGEKEFEASKENSTRETAEDKQTTIVPVGQNPYGFLRPQTSQEQNTGNSETKARKRHPAPLNVPEGGQTSCLVS